MDRLALILQILQIAAKILEAVQGMGLKMEGTVNVPDLLKLIPKSE